LDKLLLLFEQHGCRPFRFLYGPLEIVAEVDLADCRCFILQKFLTLFQLIALAFSHGKRLARG
jgi:hypothetical protein